MARKPPPPPYDSQSQLQEWDVAWTMASILGTMIALLFGVVQLQQPQRRPVDVVEEEDTTTTTKKNNPSTTSNHQSSTTTTPRWFPDPVKEPSKFAYETFVAYYTPIWISAFGAVVIFQLYEDFTAFTYLWFTSALALPLLLQPIVWPGALRSSSLSSPDIHRPLLQRYAFKANVWLATYSFIGNYWYTHYFYSVLKAQYTMPSHRLNNVPIAMYMATHFYFSSYHLLSNVLLRHIQTRYQPTRARTLLFVSTIVVLSYFTAFMETLTISSYPYYSFQDRKLAYTVGSAFYGIYFLVSFPAFYYLDPHVDDVDSGIPPMSAWHVFVQACGYGMIILFLLDFVRLHLDIPLVVGQDP